MSLDQRSIIFRDRLRVGAAYSAAVLMAGFLVHVPPAIGAEPDAPKSLITATEASSFAIRRALDQLTDVAPDDRTALSRWYADHDPRWIWTTNDRLTRRSHAVMNEIRHAADWGLDPKAIALPGSDLRFDGLAARIRAELDVGLAVLAYARQAYGGQLNPRQVSRNFDRSPPKLDGTSLLQRLAESDGPGDVLRGLHPQHEQFKRLRRAYLQVLRALDDSAGSGANRKLKALERQRRRILANMEMWRWMPRDLGRQYIAANIPEYKVRVVRESKTIHEERMVVGKFANKTPVFSDEMERIVFHPFWGVPNSIKVKELLPGLQRGSGAFARQGLRMSHRGRDVDPSQVDWSRTDIRRFHVYQPPGPRNALGVVKFLFPNKHAVYFHDTPSKHLFKRKRRAYSHGCMRVRNPLQLAQALLSSDRGWDRRKIRSVVRSGRKNNHVLLNERVPVHITYFTLWADAAGNLKSFEDIYKHEPELLRALEGGERTVAARTASSSTKAKAQLASARAKQRRSRARPDATPAFSPWQQFSDR